MPSPLEYEFENINSGEQRIYIQPGVYRGKLQKWEMKNGRYGEKLYFSWEVFLGGNGERTVTLCRFYNVKRDENGRLIFGDGHDYRKDWIRANRGRLPPSRSRLPPAKFGEEIMLLSVETVTRDGNRTLPPGSHYSKIGYVIQPSGEDGTVTPESEAVDKIKKI